MKTSNYCMTIFYCILNFYTFLSLFVFGDFFKRFSIIFQIILYFNTTLSIYLFFNIKKEPGKVDKDEVIMNNENEESNISNNFLSANLEINNLTSLTKNNLVSEYPNIFNVKCQKCNVKIVFNFRIFSHLEENIAVDVDFVFINSIIIVH
jgi:hypothetical protein